MLGWLILGFGIVLSKFLMGEKSMGCLLPFLFFMILVAIFGFVPLMLFLLG